MSGIRVCGGAGDGGRRGSHPMNKRYRTYTGKPPKFPDVKAFPPEVLGKFT